MWERNNMVILFDLDGTLLDSEQVAREARAYGFQSILGRQVTPEEEAFFLGKAVRKVLAERFPERAEELSSVIRAQYTKLSSRILPYTGVTEMLTNLHELGYTLGIVSSKRNHNIERELVATGLAPFFNIIIGQDDTLNHKPDPEPLLLAMNRLNAVPSRCVYIGDQPTDIVAAHKAGMGYVAALWGEGEEIRFREGIQTLMAHTPSEILDIIANYY